jgi:hypothetical protein
VIWAGVFAKKIARQHLDLGIWCPQGNALAVLVPRCRNRTSTCVPIQTLRSLTVQCSRAQDVAILFRQLLQIEAAIDPASRPSDGEACRGRLFSYDYIHSNTGPIIEPLILGLKPPPEAAGYTAAAARAIRRVDAAAGTSAARCDDRVEGSGPGRAASILEACGPPSQP